MVSEYSHEIFIGRYMKYKKRVENLLYWICKARVSENLIRPKKDVIEYILERPINFNSAKTQIKFSRV